MSARTTGKGLQRCWGQPKTDSPSCPPWMLPYPYRMLRYRVLPSRMLRYRYPYGMLPSRMLR